jgi:2-polyprenyl-3-methyl-5-hydroxy-6-metoxy-1,4-benzoquinol methylase
LVWSDPLPHNPREFYEKEYRLRYKGTFAPKPKHVFRAGRVALDRYGAIRKYLPKGGTVLDVGAGGGEFQYLLRKAGYRAKGIEPNIGYAEYSAREYDLDIWNGFVQDAVFPENSIDAITVWHVLEHTENPFLVLAKLHGFLKPDGVIVVEVPNVEAVCQSPSSTFHEAHIYNFNPATLKMMAQKAGFQLVHTSISSDGGNILIVGRKPTGQDGSPFLCGNDPGNADRIIRTVKGHVGYKYRLSATPYIRLCKRIGRMFAEWRGLRGYADGRALLESMFVSVADKSFV